MHNSSPRQLVKLPQVMFELLLASVTTASTAPQPFMAASRRHVAKLSGRVGGYPKGYGQ